MDREDHAPTEARRSNMKITLTITDKYCRAGKITVDDTQEYLAEVTDRKHGFKVTDTSGETVLTSVAHQPSRIMAFLGVGEHQIMDRDKRIAHIKYHGFLGLKRSINIDGKSSILPRKHLFELLDGKFSYDRKNHMVTYLNDTDISMKPLIGICFYWLLRQVRMERMD